MPLIASDDMIVIGRDTERCEGCGNSWTIKGRPKGVIRDGLSVKYAHPPTSRSSDQRAIVSEATWCAGCHEGTK